MSVLLQNLPHSWKREKLKHVAMFRVSNVDKLTQKDEQPVRLCNYTDVYHRDFITPAMPLMEATATIGEIKRFHLEAGDVVITKDSESWNDIAVPALIEETAPDLVCGYHLAMIRGKDKELDGRFLFRCFQSGVIRSQLEIEAKGVTRYGLPNSAIGETVIPIPPITIQCKIAKFLDRETSHIDALISEKESLLRLLEEKRASLISHAVTRGLNPKVKLKPSGIPWLGDVPEHWEVAQVGHRYHVNLGKMLDSKKITGEHLKPYLRNQDVQWSGISLTDLPQMDIKPLEAARFGLLPGDLLVCEGGEVGRCALWISDMECYYQKALHRLRPLTAKDSTRYFRFLMEKAVFSGVFASDSNANTIGHLPADKFRNYRMAFPPAKEQLTIANYLEEQNSNLSILVSEIQNSIHLLREKRDSLISAAVTGEIKIE